MDETPNGPQLSGFDRRRERDAKDTSERVEVRCS